VSRKSPTQSSFPTITISPLKRARFLSGLRQRQVAAELGHTPSWLSVREKGIVPVSIHDAIRLSEILRVPVTELFPKGGDR